MTGPRFDTRSLALLAAAIALTVGIALIATSGPGAPKQPERPPVARAPSPPPPPAKIRPPEPPPGDAFPHTPDGAVAAATAWNARVNAGTVNGTGRAVIDAMGTRAVQARVDHTIWVTGVLTQARLTSPGATPYLFREWPLGYRVADYSPSTARVLEWMLDVLETDQQPDQYVGYGAEEISLVWRDGTWKIGDMQRAPSLTPPGANAAAGQITAWIDAVNQLQSYTYAP